MCLFGKSNCRKFEAFLTKTLQSKRPLFGSCVSFWANLSQDRSMYGIFTILYLHLVDFYGKCRWILWVFHTSPIQKCQLIFGKDFHENDELGRGGKGWKRCSGLQMGLSYIVRVCIGVTLPRPICCSNCFWESVAPH